MGIPGLLNFFKEKFEKQSITNLKNASVCIDGHSWLHKSCSNYAKELYIDNDLNPIINYFKNKISILKNYNVSILIVFDGDIYPLKRETNLKRKKEKEKYKKLAQECLKLNKFNLAISYFKRSIDINSELLLNIFNLLKSFYKSKEKIKFMISPFEADAQLSYFQKINKIDYIITEDSDLILFGAKKLIYKFNNKHYDFLNTEKIFESYDIDFLRKISILNGCDYINGIKGIGLKKSEKLFKENKSIKKIIKKLKKEKYEIEENYLDKFNYALLSFEFHKIFCIEIKNINYLNSPDNSIYKKKLKKMIEKYGNDNFWGNEIKCPIENIKLINGIIDPVTKLEFKLNNNTEERITKIKKSVKNKKLIIKDNNMIRNTASSSTKKN